MESSNSSAHAATLQGVARVGGPNAEDYTTLETLEVEVIQNNAIVNRSSLDWLEETGEFDAAAEIGRP